MAIGVSSGFDVPGLHESMPQTREISFSDSETSFFDQLIDIVNPLQHLPGVSAIYRAVTGDEISAPAQLIGGALFGGPLGFASTVANMAFEEATGDDIAGHALALLGEEIEPPQLAAAATSDSAGPAQSETAADASLPPAVASEQRSEASGIIWNGPRVLPSLASATVDTAGGAAQTAIGATAQKPVAPPAGAQAASGAQPERGQTQMAERQPAWLNAAIADAQAVESATQEGKARQKVEAQPWITEAMLEGLRKYQALAVERSR